ncbi:MAG TPA: hypothetical protein VK956_20450, partial [Verrucomicrobium sp.]|nr:hypothetical protein [Verrucomicrobium sp.]
MTPTIPKKTMTTFGARDDLAIEVGSSLDASFHCQLDFYANGIHLNGADNTASVLNCLAYWPKV